MNEFNRIAKKEIDVVTAKKACEIIGCQAAWFHQKHRPNLILVATTETKRLYDYNHLLEYIKTLPKNKEKNYRIIE